MNCSIVYWIRGAEFADMARLSMASVRKVMPEARFVAYTDDAPGQWDLDGCSVVYQRPGRPAMVANLDAQVDFMLEHRGEGSHVLFLDVDTIMLKPFPWDPPVDLYVTWRDHIAVKNGEKVAGIAGLMPYNYGVVGARIASPAVEAFMWLRARILQMAQKQQEWYGNQLALADLCAAPARDASATRIRTIAWSMADLDGTPLIIRSLPCEMWNYTPESDDEDVSAKGILHMKGARKHLMGAYAA